MAFVSDAKVTVRDVNCGDTLEVEVTAEFDGRRDRTVSLRIPEAAQCTLQQGGDKVIKVSRPANSAKVTMTFRRVVECSRKGRTSFVLFAQASETGGATHEIQRTVTVTCA